MFFPKKKMIDCFHNSAIYFFLTAACFGIQKKNPFFSISTLQKHFEILWLWFWRVHIFELMKRIGKWFLFTFWNFFRFKVLHILRQSILFYFNGHQMPFFDWQNWMFCWYISNKSWFYKDLYDHTMNLQFVDTSFKFLPNKDTQAIIGSLIMCFSLWLWLISRISDWILTPNETSLKLSPQKIQ